VRLSALPSVRPYPRKIPGTHLCYRLSWPHGHSEVRSLGQSKNSMITTGIEPPTVWLVAQCLNQYATTCPRNIQVRIYNVFPLQHVSVTVIKSSPFIITTLLFLLLFPYFGQGLQFLGGRLLRKMMCLSIPSLIEDTSPSATSLYFSFTTRGN
jgi:hypothetical protein